MNQNVLRLASRIVVSEMCRQAASTEKLFDLIAPIAIYHKADVTFKRKAQKAFNKLKDTDPYVAKQILTIPHGSVEDVNVGDVQDAYNDLFQEIVDGMKPRWQVFRDSYGAKGFKDENGKVVFTGDDAGWFPFYESVALIKKRVRTG